MIEASLRLACVDDDTVIRNGLAHLLPAHLEVVATAARAEALLAAPDGLSVDVLLLDLALAGVGGKPVLQGRRAVERLTAAGFQVLVYTNDRRRLVLAGCLAAGARGIAHKAEPIERLVAAVEIVAAGGIAVTTALTGLAETVALAGELPDLPPRQLEILQARARGEPFKSIAARLFITRKTAEEHMASVTAKFADFLRTRSPADLERALGVSPGDLML